MSLLLLPAPPVTPGPSYTPTTISHPIVRGRALPATDEGTNAAYYGLQHNFKSPCWATLTALLDLARRPAGWNGGDIPAPNPLAIENAMRWIQDMARDALSVSGIWHEPHVAGDENGDVVFEWWHGGRSLTIYVAAEEIQHLSSWGADPLHEMSDGSALTATERTRLWLWLLSGVEVRAD